jgi:hypothetical protein
MAEVLYSFDATIADEFGQYHPRVVGRQAEDGMWEGWLEFVPIDGKAETLLTSVESRQPERSHLVYWATGLTPIYAEGALKRARNPVTVSVRMREMAASDAPAPRITARPVGPAALSPEAVLDPFEVGANSLDILRQELGALTRPRLLNIITACDLNPAGRDLAWMTDEQLVTFIVVAVEAQLLQRH